MYEVELSRDAQHFFRKCDAPLARKLARCFEALARDPRSGNNVKALKGPFAGAHRYRVGDHRVIYNINDDIVKVFIITIAKRDDVYE